MFKDNQKIKNIFFIGFLLSLHLAFTTYINSSFLASFSSEKSVGIIYILGSVASILALLSTAKIFRKLGGYKFLLYTTLFVALSLLSFTFVKSSWLVVPIFIFYFALNTLLIFSLDEIVKIFSNDASTGKVRGMYLTVTSLAWVIAQLASSQILGKFSFETVYFVTFLIMILFFLVSFFKLKNIPDPKYDKSNIIRSTKEFFRNKSLLRSYNINFLLQFFYSWMVIYTPIYLHSYLSFSWQEISTIFAIMLLPFCILPFPLGKYADKIGERKMLMFGFTVAAFATLSLFFIERHEIWIWAILLFITRIGAATIEVMSDIYFFKHIRAENEEFIGVYRSASPVSYIVGPLVALIIFTFVPSFNFIYIILGTVMLYGIYISSTIRKGDI